VLLSYAKIVLFDELTGSALPDDPYFETALIDYFPKRMHKKHSNDILGHRLQREIIATLLANDAINRGGPSFISRLAHSTGMLSSQIVRAYVMMRDGLDLGGYCDAIDTLDNRVSGAYQNMLYDHVSQIMRILVRWSAKTGVINAPLNDVVGSLRDTAKTLHPAMPELLPSFLRQEQQEWRELALQNGVDEALADKLSGMITLVYMPDIMLVSNKAGANLKLTAKTYFDVTERFRISNMESAAYGARSGDLYEELAIGRGLDEIWAARRAVTETAIAEFGSQADPVAAWHAADGVRRDRIRNRLDELIDGGEFSISKLMVAAGMMSDLAA
jgi:glutamate dehydrogenase